MRQKHKTRSNKSIKGNKHSDDSFSKSFKKKLKQYTKKRKLKWKCLAVPVIQTVLYLLKVSQMSN